MVRSSREIIARAKRLQTVMQGLRDAEEGIEVAVGQLTFLDEADMEARTGVPISIEYRDTEEELSKGIDYLRSCLQGLCNDTVTEISCLDSRDAAELEEKSVLKQADNILNGDGGN